jgi:hypothetical protein
MLKLYLFILLLFFSSITISNSQLYTRIPENVVFGRIKYFLDENYINNCFEYREDEFTLLLKCWRHNTLVNAKIIIEDHIISTKDYSKDYSKDYRISYTV